MSARSESERERESAREREGGGGKRGQRARACKASASEREEAADTVGIRIIPCLGNVAESRPMALSQLQVPVKNHDSILRKCILASIEGSHQVYRAGALGSA